MTDHPLVSIGLPVYNGMRYVPAALSSLRAQSYPRIEILISDNASTDGTWEFLQDQRSEDDRIRCHRNDRNLGARANFDRVLEMARGEFFMWAGCDDIWHADYVRTLAGLLSADTGAALAFCAFETIDEAGEHLRDHPDIFELVADRPLERLARYLGQAEELGKANLIYGLMRREVLQEAGGARHWSPRDWGVDMLIVFRVLSLGRLALCPDLLFHKRVVPSAPPAQGPRGVIGGLHGWRDDLAGWREYFKGYAHLARLAPGLTDAGRARIRRTALRRYGEVRSRALKELGRRAVRKVSKMARGGES